MTMVMKMCCLANTVWFGGEGFLGPFAPQGGVGMGGAELAVGGVYVPEVGTGEVEAGEGQVSKPMGAEGARATVLAALDMVVGELFGAMGMMGRRPCMRGLQSKHCKT